MTPSLERFTMIKRNPSMDQGSSLSKTSAILILLNYFLGYLIVYPLIGHAITKALGHTDELISNEVLIGIVLFTTITMIMLAWPIFKEERHIRPDKKVLLFVKTYGLLLLTSMIVNPLIGFLTKSDNSQNQALIVEAMQSQPVFLILSAIVMAPIVEEIVFRGVLYRKLRSEYRYWSVIFLSAITFGLMHVFQSLVERNWMDLPFIVVYTVLGLFFVKIYETSGKLSYAIILHFIHNLLGVLAILLMLSDLI